MKKMNSKKVLSLLLVVLMLFTSVPMGVFAGEESKPTMQVTNYNGDFHAYKAKVISITILDEIDTSAMNSADFKWDISANAGSGEVMAWMYQNEEATLAAGENRYDVYIAGEGGVWANEKSDDLFFGFTVLKEIKGLENLKTENVKSFAYFFNQCKSIEYLDLSSFDTSNATSFLWMFTDCVALKEVKLANWDTSKVTTMNSMFKNCYVLTELDISGWDTFNVTNMNSIFFNCRSLANLYVGEGWSTEKVTDGRMAFNCCDALPGFDPMNSQSGIEFADKYVKPAPEKPVTEKYIVTYSFAGEYPADAVLPDAVEYEKGVTVVVEPDSVSQDATYVFNGWTSEDADISTGSFTIENDVEIVGSWTKLYKVEYKYDKSDERYEVPAGAPTEEMLDTLSSLQKAGDDVDVFGVLPAPERYIFVGWYTKDADVAGNMFTMPEKDVTLYGYFKIPIESIEFLSQGETIVIDKNSSELPNFNNLVYVNPEDATIKDIVFESSDESVVKVTENGEIENVGEGTATITVYSKDDPSKGDTIEVTVKTSVTKLEVDKTDITLNKDDTDKITVTIEPDTATNKDVTFESNDEKVAKVDDNGNITAVGEGTTTIVVTSKDNPELKKEVTVTVKIPVTKVEAGEDFDLNIGDEKQLEVSVNKDATNKELTYESNDPGVVKVDSTGNVIAVGEGTATITVTSKDDPNKKDTIEITVYCTYQVTYEYINKPAGATELPATVRYRAGDKVVVADNATAEGYTFSGWSTDVNVTDGEFTMPARDVVLKGSFKKDVDGITINIENKELEIGEKGKVEVTVTPDDADNKEVTYKSSDETVVKVDNDGNIEAVDEGKATITVTSKDNPAKKDTIEITVYRTYQVSYEYINKPAGATELPETVRYRAGDKVVVADNATAEGYTFSGWSTDVNVTGGEFTMPARDVVLKGSFKKDVDGITIKVENNELEIGEKGKVEVTVTPDNADNKEVTYESSDETVVKVDEKGNIEAVGEGKATITVTSKDNATIVEQITVTVKKPVVDEPEVDNPDIDEPDVDEPDIDEPDDDKPDVNYTMEYPMSVVVKEGETKNLGVKVVPEEGAPAIKYTSSDESIVVVDADGNITGVAEGTANITAELPNGNFVVIAVTVTFKTSHYIVFGKTEKIGWYSVSMDGGETFMVVFGNSNLEVAEGTELLIRANDVLGDPFTFYINGNGTTPDENGYVRVVVDGYMLIGALGVPVIAPDTEESLNLIQRLIKSIKDFFARIASFFGF